MFLADFWFLIALMLASILFFPVADNVLKSKARSLTAVVLLLAVTGVFRGFGISLPYNIQLIPFWTALMLLGAFAGNNKIFDIPSLSGSKELLCGAASLTAGILISAFKVPNVNIFRGSFENNEVISMLLMVILSLFLIWGSGILFKRIESSGIRVKELSRLGSHSLLIYIYHMFFAWIISQITGFSLSYTDPAEPSVIAKSLLLTAVCLTLCILRYIIGDKIAKSGRSAEKSS